MKRWFSLALLVAAVAYTAFGLATLNLLNMSGRPGAGYFPLIIGVLLIIATAVNAYRDFRALRIDRKAKAETDMIAEVAAAAASAAVGAPNDTRRYGADVAIMLAMLFAFILSLKILGGLLAMIVFMLAFLFFFNRGKVVINLVYSFSLPLFLYLLFKVTLNASLPIGFLGF